MISSGVYRFLGMMLTSWVVVHSNIGTGPNEPGRSQSTRGDMGTVMSLLDGNRTQSLEHGLVTAAVQSARPTRSRTHSPVRRTEVRVGSVRFNMGAHVWTACRL